MKKRDYREFKMKEITDIKKAFDEKKSDLIKVGPAIKAGKEKNLKKAKNLRREIAQILTAIKEKEISKKEAIKK